MKILQFISIDQLNTLYIYSLDQEIARMSWPEQHDLAETLNLKIDEILKESKLNINDIQGLGIFAGPGSFTSLRISHSVFNTLAYLYKIPIVSSNETNWLQINIKELTNGNNMHQVVPFYGEEARVTKPRK